MEKFLLVYCDKCSNFVYEKKLMNKLNKLALRRGKNQRPINLTYKFLDDEKIDYFLPIYDRFDI